MYVTGDAKANVLPNGQPAQTPGVYTNARYVFLAAPGVAIQSGPGVDESAKKGDLRMPVGFQQGGPATTHAGSDDEQARAAAAMNGKPGNMFGA